MSLYLVALLVFAAWFSAACVAVVFLYACALWVDSRRRRVIEGLERCPDHVPADWATELWVLDVTERRSKSV